MGGTHAGLAPRHPPWFRAPARAGRRPAFQAVPAIAPSAICHPICWGVRPETGAIPAIGVFAAAALRAAVPAGGRRSKPSLPLRLRLYAIPSVGGYVPRREPSRRLGSSPPRPCGPLCRPEAGVPSRPCHCAFGYTPSHLFGGYVPRREAFRRLESSPPRPAGRYAGRRPAFQAVPAMAPSALRALGPIRAVGVRSRLLFTAKCGLAS